jgi:hypothetical protein
MWQKINPVGVEELESTRIHLHKALQLISGAPRSYLPFNKNDQNKFLTWDCEEHSFISKSFDSIKLSLDIRNFVLSILKSDGTKAHLVLSGMTYPLAFGWMQVKLDKLGLDPVQFTDKAPYVIKNYGFDQNQELNIGERATIELCKYFDNANSYLNTYDLNSTVLCDPQYFDLFITIKHPDTGKSIKIGFCPGDENYIEPYYFLKLNSTIQSTAGLPELQTGLWHNIGWSGAVILYSEITNIEPEKEIATTSDFFKNALMAVKDIH